MKNLLANIFIIFIVFCILFFVPAQVSAAFEAGHTKNWPETTNGAKGKVLSSYNIGANFYNTNETISLEFAVENPQNNTQTINQNLSLHIWKVENVNAETETIAEESLYQNHNAQQDSQTLYKAIPLGELILAPGETAPITATFTIEDSGYYQFDLTELPPYNYQPGHIYAAGFIRVKGTDKTVLGTQTEKEKKQSSMLGKSIVIGSISSLILLLLWYFMRKRRSIRRA